MNVVERYFEAPLHEIISAIMIGFLIGMLFGLSLILLSQLQLITLHTLDHWLSYMVVFCLGSIFTILYIGDDEQ